MTRSFAYLRAAMFAAAAIFLDIALADLATEASWELDCSSNLIVKPPSDKMIMFGGDGKLSFNPTTGDIASDQMAEILAKLDAAAADNAAMASRQASMQGSIEGLKTGLANATATIQVLADEAGVLKADNVVLKADTAALKVDKAAMAADNAALQERVATLENGGGVQQDTESEETGEVVASGVFCTAWGSALEFLTGKIGSCDFPTVMENDVVLEGWMIPLMKHVRRVKGSITIASQHYLKSLSSVMPNLEEVTGDVTISFCNGLVGPVAGFATLMKIGGALNIKDNPNLEILDGTLMPNLNITTGKVSIRSNGALLKMDGFLPALTTCEGSVDIQSNGKLATLVNVCNALVTAGGVTITNTPVTALDGSTGFGQLATSTGRVYIYNNDAMLKMDGFLPALTVATSIEIGSNSILASVPGNSLGSPGGLSLGGTFELYSNPKLADVSGFHGIKCTASAQCAMHWYFNDLLTQQDVCGVWTAMTGTGATKSGNNFPRYGTGSTNNWGLEANC